MNVFFIFNILPSFPYCVIWRSLQDFVMNNKSVPKWNQVMVPHLSYKLYKRIYFVIETCII